jgi:hypothetical protein
MTHSKAGARRHAIRYLVPAAAALAIAAPAAGVDFKTSGRVTFGASYRLESADPNLLYSFNAAAIGLTGLTASGQNADDANTNFRKHDATSRVLKGYLDLAASEGKFSALVRIKAWRDFALRDNPRAWGNSPSGYTPGAPLSDRGAPLLSRFSGVALSDYYLQHSTEIGGKRVLGRIGQQSLSWGERASFAGGLAALNPADFPAIRRAGVVPQETKVPVPALFGRVDMTGALALEGFVQTRFRPSALDMCGTFWSVADYLVNGCDKAYAGQPAASDRTRDRNGAYLKRIASPSSTRQAQYGAGLAWKSAALATDFGLYHARYIGRTPTPGLRKSTRIGPALVAGDPDGKNIAFFTEYVPGIELYALTFARKMAGANLYGEVSYRPKQPLQLPPGDVLGALLNPTSPALLRADATALAPGGYFHGYDRYPTTQTQVGVQRDWKLAGGTVLAGAAELVHKHVGSLPDPAVRRYLRADHFGVGPIFGVCNSSTATPEKQCTQDGYVSSDAYAYRLRLDARYTEVLPGLNCNASAIFTHEVKGWSYDSIINQGRRTLNLALRMEYRQRYLAEVSATPIWGGTYNAQSDRDQLAMAVGVRF